MWAVSIWSNTQMKLIEAPAKMIEKGIDEAKDALKPGN